MNPRGRGDSLRVSRVCPLPDHGRGLAVKTVKAAPHKSGGTSSHQYLTHGGELSDLPATVRG